MAYKTSKTYITKSGERKTYPKLNLLTVQLNDEDLDLLEALRMSGGKKRSKAAVIRELIRNASK